MPGTFIEGVLKMTSIKSISTKKSLNATDAFNLSALVGLATVLYNEILDKDLDKYINRYSSLIPKNELLTLVNSPEYIKNDKILSMCEEFITTIHEAIFLRIVSKNLQLDEITNVEPLSYKIIDFIKKQYIEPFESTSEYFN